LFAGPATFFLETFDSLHLPFGFIAQRLDLRVDFLLGAGGSTAGKLSGPDGLHHLQEPIRLDEFSDWLDGHVDRSRGKGDLLRYLQCPVRLDRAFNDDSPDIHDFHLTSSLPSKLMRVCTSESNSHASEQAVGRGARLRYLGEVKDLRRIRMLADPPGAIGGSLPHRPSLLFMIQAPLNKKITKFFIAKGANEIGPCFSKIRRAEARRILRNDTYYR
jgi:hypothetical protein